jgi:hypothetical protein
MLPRKEGLLTAFFLHHQTLLSIITTSMGVTTTNGDNQPAWLLGKIRAVVAGVPLCMTHYSSHY